MATPGPPNAWAKTVAVTAGTLAVTVPAIAVAAGAQEGPTSTSLGPSTSDTAAAVVRLDPTEVDFGTVVVGQSEAQTVTVTAEGASIEDINVFVDDPFEVDSGCIGVELEPGHSCDIEVRFAPTGPGPVSGTLEVDSSIGIESAGVGGIGTTSTSTTPSTTPSATTATTGDDVPPTTATTIPETREECDARAREARISYAEQRQMHVGETEAIVVEATTGEPRETTTSGPGPSTTVVEQPLRCRVRARLVGNDFTIDPEDWQHKSFHDTDEVSWLWSVTPLVTGNNLLLILEVQGLRFDEDADEYVEAGEAFETIAQIEVDSRPRSLVSQVNSAVTGVVTHPVVALLASTGALALLSRWAYLRFRGPHPSGDHSESPPEASDDDPS